MLDIGSEQSFHTHQAHDIETVTTNEQMFNLRHKEVIGLYSEYFKSPNPNLVTVTVIPTWGELKNDNFWRLLWSLSNQRGVKDSQYEAYFVVNNSKKDALEQSEIFKENQETLKILSVLAESSGSVKTNNRSIEEAQQYAIERLEDIELTNWEKRVLKKTIEKQVRVYGINVSSYDKAIEMPETEEESQVNPRGVALDIGGHIAYERLKRTKAGVERGAVDIIGADCFLPRNYYQELTKTLLETDHPWFTKALVSQLVDISEYARRETDPVKKVARIILQAYQYVHGYYAYFLCPNPQKNGATQVVRGEVFRKVGGFERNRPHEDARFADDVEIETDSYAGKVPNTFVNLSIRGGREHVDDRYIGYLFLHERKSGFEALQAVQNDRAEGSQDRIKQLLLFNERMMTSEKRDEYLKLRQNYFRTERLQRLFFIDKARKFINFIVASPQQRSETTDAYLDRLNKIGVISDREYDLLHSNIPILEMFSILVGMIDDPRYNHLFIIYKIKTDDKFSKIWTFLEENIPEFFRPPPDKEPDYQQAKEQIDEGIQVNYRDFMHLARVYYDMNS